MKSEKNPWYWIPLLNFASGFPYAIIISVSVLMYKNLGINKERIFFLNYLENGERVVQLEHYQQKTLDFIYKHIQDNHLKVLEVGGVPSDKDTIAKRLAKKNYMVTQIDLWSNIIEERYDGIHFMKMDANNTSFEDSSFDVIFGSAVLEHISNLDIFCIFYLTY